MFPVSLVCTRAVTRGRCAFSRSQLRGIASADHTAKPSHLDSQVFVHDGSPKKVLAARERQFSCLCAPVTMPRALPCVPHTQGELALRKHLVRSLPRVVGVRAGQSGGKLMVITMLHRIITLADGTTEEEVRPALVCVTRGTTSSPLTRTLIVLLVAVCPCVCVMRVIAHMDGCVLAFPGLLHCRRRRRTARRLTAHQGALWKNGWLPHRPGAGVVRVLRLANFQTSLAGWHLHVQVVRGVFERVRGARQRHPASHPVQAEDVPTKA